jgi:PTS hybrid protein
MVTIVLVSHSLKVAQGTREVALQMAQADVSVVALGGTADGRLGNDPDLIRKAVEAAAGGDGVVVLPDFGGSAMAVGMVVDMLPESLRSNVRVANAPFVEGAVAAVLQASLGDDLDGVLSMAESAIAIAANKRGD